MRTYSVILTVVTEHDGTEINDIENIIHNTLGRDYRILVVDIDIIAEEK